MAKKESGQENGDGGMAEDEQYYAERREAWLERMKLAYSKMKHPQLRIAVEIFYDHQKHRIATGNRIFILPKMDLEVPPEFELYKTSLKENEKSLVKPIARELQGVNVYRDWLSKVPGVAGPLMSGGLIAWIDDVGKFDTVSKLWRFAGFGVIDGKAEKATKDTGMHYSAKLHTHCWKVGGALLKTKGFYYEQYLRFRAAEEENPELRMQHEEAAKASKRKSVQLSLAGYHAHIHMRAMRKMIKLFLSHLWEEWRRLDGYPVNFHYAQEVLHHEHRIEPPHEIKH